MFNTSSAIRLGIVDDHQLVRDGLKALLAVVPGLVVIGEAGSGEQALALADAMEIDLMLVDVGLKGMNGIQLASALLARHPDIKVLMLSMYDNREYVLSAIRAGARGYVLKESPTEDILSAISVLSSGGNYFSAPVASLINQANVSKSELTSREHEILILLAHGESNKAVARRLDISVRTVEAHRLNLRRKLGADSPSELLKIALSNGWTTL